MRLSKQGQVILVACLAVAIWAGLVLLPQQQEAYQVKTYTHTHIWSYIGPHDYRMYIWLYLGHRQDREAGGCAHLGRRGAPAVAAGRLPGQSYIHTYHSAYMTQSKAWPAEIDADAVCMVLGPREGACTGHY